VPRDVFAHHLVPRLDDDTALAFAASCVWARSVLGAALPLVLLRCKLRALARVDHKGAFDLAVAQTFGVPRTLRPRGALLCCAISSATVSMTEAVGCAMAWSRARQQALAALPQELPQLQALLNRPRMHLPLELGLGNELHLTGAAAVWMSMWDPGSHKLINERLRLRGPKDACAVAWNQLYAACTPALLARWGNAIPVVPAPHYDARGVVRSLTEDNVLIDGDPSAEWTMVVRGKRVVRVARISLARPAIEIVRILGVFRTPMRISGWAVIFET
jgi:hypothetical protein